MLTVRLSLRVTSPNVNSLRCSAASEAAILTAMPAGMRLAGNNAQRQLAKRRAGDLLPIIKELRPGGATSLKAVADGLNARNIPTAHDGKWQPTQVMRVLARQ